MAPPEEHFKVMAPTRVDLAGGTLDLWPIYTLFDSAKTINLALDLFAVAEFSVSTYPHFRVEIHGADGKPFAFSEPIPREKWETIPAAVRFPSALVSLYLAEQSELPKLSLKTHLSTQAPLRSGLGGSSALCVAITRGMARVFGDFSEQGWQWDLMDWAKDAEAGYLNTPTGVQDYLAALFGGLNCFTFRVGKKGCEPYSAQLVKALESHLLVLFSGEMHHSGMSNWELFKKAMEGDAQVLGGLGEIRNIAEELDRELRHSRLDWNQIGRLLNEEWRVRQTTFHVETPRLEEIVSFLSRQSILGAKVCGAAQGGSLIVLVDPPLREQVAKTCEKNGIQVLKTEPSLEGVSIHPL